jgi:hypothetical protein
MRIWGPYENRNYDRKTLVRCVSLPLYLDPCSLKGCRNSPPRNECTCFLPCTRCIQQMVCTRVCRYHRQPKGDTSSPIRECIRRATRTRWSNQYTLEVERESAARRKSFIMMFRVGAVLLRRRREVGGLFAEFWFYGRLGRLGSLRWDDGRVGRLFYSGRCASEQHLLGTYNKLFKQSVTMKQERNQENTAHH